MKTNTTNVFSLFSVFLLSLAMTYNCGMPDSYPDGDAPTPQSGQNEVIVKVDSSVALSTIDSLVPGARVKVLAEFGGFRYLLYTTDGSRPADEISATVRKNEVIAYAEPNHSYHAFRVPNDPLYSTSQYAPRLTGCETAWDVHTGNDTVTVAVVDTGINGQHEDFGDRVAVGYNYCSQNTDIPSGEIAAGANSDDAGHGTHVAGIIGARGDNGVGIAGVAWNIRLMPLKVLDKDGSGRASDIVSAIIRAVTQGADIINLSLGGPYYSQAMCNAVEYACANNVVVVAAMGNDGYSTISYPAGYSGVIAVACTNGLDEISSFSTRGRHCSLAAPGENICSLSNTSNHGYVCMSGTSMAAPFVAGTAALMLSADPGLTPAQVRYNLEQGNEDKGAPGFDPVYGFGRVNVSNKTSPVRYSNYGNIKVRVFDETGNPVPNLEIQLHNGEGHVVTAGLTGTGTGAYGIPRGEINFRHVAAGTYTVTLSYLGAFMSQSAVCNPDSETTVNFNYSPAAHYMIEVFPNGRSSAGIQVALALFDSTGTRLLADHYQVQPPLSYPLLSGNTYYIRFKSLDIARGGYSLLVSRTGGGSSTGVPEDNAGEPDNTYQEAFPILPDTVYDRYLDREDQDWFRITMP